MGKKASGGKLLAVADPVFQVEDARLGEEGGTKAAAAKAKDGFPLQMMREVRGAALSRVGWKVFPRLAVTGEIGRRLRDEYGDAATVLEGKEASEGRVKKLDLSGYGRGIVFATHGILDDRVPYLQQASLVLSNPELTGEVAEEGNDGFLTMTEIMGLKMPTELVAALACNTGMGGEVAGEGVMHLGRAFQYAGARSVLMSLWSVESATTVTLGMRVLEGMGKKGEAKDEALQAAREELRKAGFQHPFFWAGFVLVGERGASGGK